MMRKTPHSLPRNDYGGTGKRLFIGLMMGTALLICLFLLLSWLIPMLGFAGIHPWLPSLASLFFGGAFVLVLWVAAGLALYAYTGRPLPGVRRFWGVTVRFLLPLMEMVGKIMGIPAEAVRRSFIKVNNEMVLGSGLRCTPEQVLVLLPHCIQYSRCAHRLNDNMDNCTRCGQCPIRDMLRLRDAWGVTLAIASGGTVARRIVVQNRPKLILAVACERDLASGIQDTCPLPVFGVLNERPNGPCVNTLVSVPLLEKALQRFVEKP